MEKLTWRDPREGAEALEWIIELDDPTAEADVDEVEITFRREGERLSALRRPPEYAERLSGLTSKERDGELMGLLDDARSG